MSRELVRIRKKSFQEGMATSTDVIDAETMLSKVQIAFLLAYYKYDVALASLLSTCGMPESFWQYSRTDKLRTLYSENNKKRKQYGKREETVRSRFYRCSCGHCYGVCHWDYSYER